MAQELPWKRRTNPDAYPQKHLYIDMLWTPDDDDDVGVQYRFDFRTREEVDNSESCWFEVKDILKALARIHPARVRFAVGLDKAGPVTAYSGTEPCAVGASLSAMAESPFALSGNYPSRSRLQAAWAGVTRPSLLLRTHAPDLNAPRTFALARFLGLCRLLRAPAANRPFPTLSLQSFSRRLDPYPAAIPRCSYSFLPERHRPHVTRDTFGSPDNPCIANFYRGHISGLQSFAHVQAPELARPPGCPHRFLRRAARPFTPRIARLGYLPRDVVSLRV